MASSLAQILQIASFVISRYPDAERLFQAMQGMTDEERQALYVEDDESFEAAEARAQAILAKRRLQDSFPSTQTED